MNPLTDNRIAFVILKYAFEVSPTIKELIRYLQDNNFNVDIITDKLHRDKDFSMDGVNLITIESLSHDNYGDLLKVYKYLFAVEYLSLTFLSGLNIPLSNVIYLSLESTQLMLKEPKEISLGRLNQCMFGIIQSQERYADFYKYFNGHLQIQFEYLPVSIRPVRVNNNKKFAKIIYSGYLSEWSGMLEFLNLFKASRYQSFFDLTIQGHSIGTETYVNELKKSANGIDNIKIDTGYYDDKAHFKLLSEQNIGIAVYKNIDNSANWDNLLFSSGKIAAYLWAGCAVVTNLEHELTKKPPFIYIKDLNDISSLERGFDYYINNIEMYYNEGILLAQKYYNLDTYAVNILKRLSPGNKCLQNKIKIYKQDETNISSGENNSNFLTNGENNFVNLVIAPGSIIFDVGANIGKWSETVYNEKPGVTITAFEPVPEIFNTLKKNLSGIPVKLENIAISSSEGHEQFFYYDQQSDRFSGLSTFYRRNDAEKELNIIPKQVRVKKTTLDGYCKNNNIDKIDFLKIDTEGSEKDVLIGALNLFKDQKVKILQFEYGGTYLDANIKLKEILKLLSEKEYRVFKIIPDGLIHIAEWTDELENYQYANYCAVTPEYAPDLSVTKFYDETPTLEKEILSKNILKLHLGCGQKYFEGYVNIDFPSSHHTTQIKDVADYHADITKLNFPPGSIEEVRLHHLFEHFSRPKALALLCNWHKWLKIGGVLTIETPDFENSTKIFLSNEFTYEQKQVVMRHVFGSHEADWAVHWDGWYPEKYIRTLKALGFDNINIHQDNWKLTFNITVQAVKTRNLSPEEINNAAYALLSDSMVDHSDSEKRQLQVWKNSFLEMVNGQPVESIHGSVDDNVVFLIVSKDRPLQLEACLQSLINACPAVAKKDIHILYKASSPDFSNAYSALEIKYPEVVFKKEKAFKDDLLSIIDGYDYLMFIVDDTVFTREINIKDVVKALDDNYSAIGFSLRLGQNITNHYPSATSQPKPEFITKNKNLLSVNWTKSEKYFAYPLEVSSSVYRIKDIAGLLKSGDYFNPNTLEQMLAENRMQFSADQPFLLMNEYSSAFSIPANLVQKDAANRNSGVEEYSAKSLLEKFNRGYKIDIEKYKGYNNSGCHEDVPLQLIYTGDQNLPLLSIYMAVYNSEKYLAETLDSIINQTFTGWELVIVDDGSTDKSPLILKEYEKRDKRIQVHLQENQGVVAARNYALQKVSPASQYLMNHDSDDISEPEKVEKIINYLECHKDISIAGCFATYFNDDNSTVPPPPFLESDPVRIKETFGELNSVVHSAAIIRRKVFDSIGNYSSDFPVVQDYDLFARALMKGFKIANIPEYLHRIRLHNQSIGARKGALQQELALKIKEKYKRYLRGSNKNKDNNLNILHTVEFYHPHTGGAELVIKQLSERLVKRGHSVTVATTKLADRNITELNGVYIAEFDVRGSLAGGIAGNDIVKYQDFLVTNPADIMMNYAAQQWGTDVAFSVFDKLVRSRVNIIAPCGYSALQDSKTLRWPQFAQYFNEFIPKVIPAYDAAIYHSSKYQDYEFAADHGFNNSIIIPNGVGEEEFETKPKINFREKYNVRSKYMGLCVANYYKDKGQERIIEALRKSERNDFTVVFIGKEGDELDNLRKMAGNLNIIILANISREDTLAAFHQADLFLFGSRIEAFPLVILEAKASKTAFISTNCGNVKELKGGMVCGSEDEISVNINKLLDNETLRKKLANEGYKEWKEKFTWEAITDKYEDLYKRLYHKKFVKGTESRINIIRSEIEQQYTNINSYLYAAKILSSRNKHEEARKYLEDALEIDFQNSEAEQLYNLISAE